MSSFQVRFEANKSQPLGIGYGVKTGWIGYADSQQNGYNKHLDSTKYYLPPQNNQPSIIP